MLVLDAAAIRSLAPISGLIECLKEAFGAAWSVPLRQVVQLPKGAGERLFVSMPAFAASGAGIVKLATVFAENSASGKPTVQGCIVVFSDDGSPIAVLDGVVVTHLRTAAASALASLYLSRPGSKHLVIIGTGALAPAMALAHSEVRPITRISVWGRRPHRAVATANAIRELVSPKVAVNAEPFLEQIVSTADVVSCVTSSTEPVLAGRWLRAGAFVDLVGSFSPSKRESDDDVMVRSRIFVDTFDGAIAEAGDILQPLTRGIIVRDRIEGQLSDLVRGTVTGRTHDEEIIVFKSVGTAVEDLAAAQLIMGNYAHR
jgi:alanine dehydrogenase